MICAIQSVNVFCGAGMLTCTISLVRSSVSPVTAIAPSALRMLA